MEPTATIEPDDRRHPDRSGDTASPALPHGATLGRYVVLEPLGSGGMGVVYSAFDPKLDRRVALKLVHPRHLRSRSRRETQQRLEREAQALARMSHPNVLAVHDVGDVGG
ncbi:MAG: protein kinase, partial [Acidobacteriota bacterium]